MPLLTATACRTPTYLAIACSNSTSLGPRLRLDDSSTSKTARRSRAVISGPESGIFIPSAPTVLLIASNGAGRVTRYDDAIRNILQDHGARPDNAAPPDLQIR